MNQSISLNIEYFVEKIKKEQIRNDHLLVSFDVKSQFTNVPLDKVIEITLNRIYDKNEISTDIITDITFMFKITVLQCFRHWEWF